jgi:predicted CxxxxCH...CXXCH cytochrome family protein
MADVTCATCHNGAGSDTANHARGAVTVSPLPVAFRAKTLTGFGYDATTDTCSGIACHGGVKTPAWNLGTIIVATDCRKCHEQGTAPQSPQYNSFWSGSISYGGPVAVNLHQLHLGLPDLSAPSGTKISCSACHNAIVQKQGHFLRLYDPTASPVSAAATIGGVGTKITAYTPYTAAVPSGRCATSCHVDRNWIN